MSDDVPERDLRQDLRRILRSLARQRATISYRELAQLAEVPPPQSIHKLTQALEAMMREDHQSGTALLSALVISRGASGLPQRGFFDLLRALGRYDGPDSGSRAEAVFREELELAWDDWGRGER